MANPPPKKWNYDNHNFGGIRWIWPLMGKIVNCWIYATDLLRRAQSALPLPTQRRTMFFICLHGHVKCQVKGETLQAWRGWPVRGRCVQERAPRLPAAQEHRATALPSHACSAVMGKQRDRRPRGWPVFAARVFVLHRVFTQNTSGPLRTRSAHPSNLLCRQRQSVPPRTTPHPKWPSGHTQEAAVSRA